MIKPGLYCHYKGNFYRVIDIAIHSETLEKMVLYREVSKTRKYWVRPLDMFKEKVKHNGVEMKRFEFVREE